MMAKKRDSKVVWIILVLIGILVLGYFAFSSSPSLSPADAFCPGETYDAVTNVGESTVAYEDTTDTEYTIQLIPNILGYL